MFAYDDVEGLPVQRSVVEPDPAERTRDPFGSSAGSVRLQRGLPIGRCGRLGGSGLHVRVLRRLLPGSAGGLRDLGSPEAAGQLSAVLFFLCGLLVVAASPAINGPQVHRLLLVLVGLTAAVSGVVIVALPWDRWPRAATLWLVPMAFGLIALHNWATGGDGIRYNVFFLVVAAWVGLMHPRGTTLACTPRPWSAPTCCRASPSATSLTSAVALTYAVPVFVLVGESASLVAERVRISEAKVRASEQRFRALVQNSADAISVVGADATILWDSPGITSVLGYEPEDRVGTAGFDYLHPDDAEEAANVLGELLNAPGTTRSVELRVRHHDGSWRYCQMAGRSLLDEPAVGGIVVNISDVTQQHEAVSALADSEASFRLLFSANPQPMWVYDDETLRFIEVNDAAVPHYGYTREEFLAMTIADIRPPEELERLMHAVAKTHVARHSDKWRHHLTDGRPIEVEITPIRSRSRAATRFSSRCRTSRSATCSSRSCGIRLSTTASPGCRTARCSPTASSTRCGV